jgi:hypothetical protein
LLLLEAVIVGTGCGGEEVLGWVVDLGKVEAIREPCRSVGEGVCQI